MKLLMLVLTFTISSRAFAHAGCSGEPFADRFCEIADTAFKVRPLPRGQAYSYIQLKSGERLVLDSKYQMAVRRQLGTMVERAESENLYSRVGWGEWFKWHAKRKVQEFNHIASRRFVLELAGGGLEIGYRFGRLGLLAPPVYVGGELLEHGLLWGAAFYFKSATLTAIASFPWCGVVYGSCLLLAKEAQEFGNVLTREYPREKNLMDRYAIWRQSKKMRREIRRALKSVRRTSDDVDLSERAYRRSFRDFSSGAEVVWGGPIQAGYFRSLLGMPICEDCDDNRLKTFRYKGFGGTTRPTIPPTPNEIPIIDDLGSEASSAQRFLRTEEYVAFVDTIFAHATLAAGDLIRNTQLNAEGMSERVPLATTFRKARGYLSLRRDVGRMRKALSLYTHVLRMRAVQTEPRSAEDEAFDRDFTATLGQFVGAFNEKLKRIDAFEHQKKDKESLLWTAPKRAFDNLRDWIRTGQFCAEGLVAVPAT